MLLAGVTGMLAEVALLGVMTAGVVMAGCGGEEQPEGCADSALTYETFGEAFLTSWCRGCHSRDLAEELRQGAPLEVNFNTRADARMRGRRAAFLVGDARTMPPAGGPSESERALLVEWMSCGVR